MSRLRVPQRNTAQAGQGGNIPTCVADTVQADIGMLNELVFIPAKAHGWRGSAEHQYGWRHRPRTRWYGHHNAFGMFTMVPAGEVLALA